MTAKQYMGEIAQFVYDELTFFRFVAIVVGAAVLVIMVIEACLGFHAAYVFNSGAVAGLMATAAITLAIFKGVWLTAALDFLKRRSYTAAGGAVILGALCHLYSMQAGLGLAAEGRDAVTSDRGAQIQARARAQDAYDTAKRQVGAGQRPSLQVKDDIQATELVLRDAQTRQAAAVAERDAQKASGLGPRYNQAVADERIASQKVEEARTKIESLKSEMTLARQAENAVADMKAAEIALGKLNAPTHADPQAHNLSSYLNAFGFNSTAAGVSLALPLPLVLFVEFAGVLGLMIAASFWQMGSPVRPEPVQQASYAVATRIIEAQPQPVAMLPEPLKPEEQALRDLKSLIAHGNAIGQKVGTSSRKLIAHFNAEMGRSYAHSTFAGWASTWVKEGKIQKVAVGKNTFYDLPPMNRLAARRELRAA